MEMSSTRISDLPENITMQFGNGMGTGMSHGGMGMGGVSDRGIDMASASYRQMNPHQNPFMQGQSRMDAMPPPAFKQGGRDAYMQGQGTTYGQGTMPPPPMPPSYDFDQGPLGNSPQFPLPPKDIPIDTSGFRDESARPNYVPPAAPDTPNFVLEQEDRLREQKQAEASKQAINKQFDLIAELQMPLIVGIMFWLFQMEMWNKLLAKYFKSLGLFREDGTLNMRGILLKSVAFGSAYYGIVQAIKMVDE